MGAAGADALAKRKRVSLKNMSEKIAQVWLRLGSGCN